MDACTTSVVFMATICALMAVTGAVHVHIEYDNPNAVTCYTCPSMANNTNCNKWAPDVPCPVERAVCKTIHRLSRVTGVSVHVEKSCALPEHCSGEHVGCKDTDVADEIECVSCCTKSYCNVAVPNNVSTSHELSLSLVPDSSSSHVTCTLWNIVVTTVGLTWILRGIS